VADTRVELPADAETGVGEALADAAAHSETLAEVRE
jgi:hypothetical protein